MKAYPKYFAAHEMFLAHPWSTIEF
jgi:hypothetical protein